MFIRGCINKSLMILSIGMLFLTGCGRNKAGEYTKAGYDAIENNQFTQAMESFEKADENGEDILLIERGKGIASYYLMDYQGAVDHYHAAMTHTGSSVTSMDYDLNFYLAQAYEKLDEFDRAIATYTAILDLSTKDVQAYYYRGTDYLKTGEHDLAIEDFEKALSLDPNNYDLRIEIAGRLSDNYYEEEGIKYLQNFLVENEKKLSSFDRGRIYYYMGNLDEAKVLLEDARDDDDQSTVLFLGKTYEKLGDYNYAASVYDNFLKRHPESALIYNQLGLCKLQSGDHEAALNAFVSAKNIENNGMEQILSYNEIVACEYMGDFKKAKNLMASYLTAYPDDDAAKKENVFLSTR